MEAGDMPATPVQTARPAGRPSLQSPTFAPQSPDLEKGRRDTSRPSLAALSDSLASRPSSQGASSVRRRPSELLRPVQTRRPRSS
eukprot:7872717-Alexandrium_andersonii.AAC.1